MLQRFQILLWSNLHCYRTYVDTCTARIILLNYKSKNKNLPQCNKIIYLNIANNFVRFCN